MLRIYQNKTAGIGFLKNRSLIFLLFILSTVFSLQSAAQNYIVNSNIDAVAANLVTGETATPGQITLRSAVQAATAQPGAHIITFSGTVVSPINLSLGQITLGNAANGNNITITGPGMNLLTVNQTTENRIFSTGTGAVTILLQDITFNYAGPAVTPYSGGGGAIIAGGAGAASTFINCRFTNFQRQLGNGGAISQSSSLTSHNLTITNCIFTNNRAGGAGGAVSFNSQGGTATITGCTFDNNHTGPVGANTGGDGGALSVTGGGSGGTYLVERNTFINNQVENVTGHAGAVMNTNGTLTLRFNRFIGNTCANVAFPPLANIVGQAGGATIHVTIADNNWWGVNTGPGTNDATALAAGAVMTVTKWLQLKTTALPNPICNTPAGLGNTTTVTTSFLSNSANEAIAVSNLSRLISLPVTWGPTTLGSLSGQQGTIQAAGTATALFTSNGTGGTATVNTQVDNIPAGETSPARANITVNTLPIVTNPANFTSCVGGTATFTSTITGTPVPTITWYKGGTPIVNGPTGTGATYSGATTNTLTITNVQPGDAGNYNVDAVNHCGMATSSTAALIVNAVTGGTVAVDQTICTGGDPAAFTETGASIGSGALTYQWQSSTTSCGAGFSDIGGATGTTYDPPAGLAITTFYRRVTTSTLNTVPCTANSNCITVTVNAVTGGTVAADQTICSGGDPAAFTQTVASIGGGALTYQWQSSTTSCAAGFSDIAGATATTYDPPAGLLVTTYYRRVVTSTLNAVACTANSNCVTVSVNDVTGGTVGSDETICFSGDPAAFTQTVASTGSGALTYQWQSSTTSCAAGFSNIGGATAFTYDPPTGLTVTTYYRRLTISTLNAVPCTANSNCITVTINDVTGGTVAADQTICSGGDPAAFTETAASTGSGVLTYQWQSSTTSCAAGFSNIGGATATTYDPPTGLLVTTFYRRVTTSMFNAVSCTANSNCITVTVNNVTGGTVGSDQSVCTGGDPAILVQLIASTGSGALTYQWESSTTSCAAGFSNIGGATAISYNPPAGLAVTTYYRRVTTSTLNGVPCIANSNCITVMIDATNTITLTSAPGTDNQSVLLNTPITNITYSTTGATGATFAGLPAGVTGAWAANVVTISGSPSAAGLFNYTVTLTGGCGNITATGSINVIACSITLTSAAGTNAQSVCLTNPIINITYATAAATGASFSGLPAGVSGAWAANVATISGTPTGTGISNYTVTLTGGGCGAFSAIGSITVIPTPDVDQPANQVVCNGASTGPVTFTGSVTPPPGTVFNWTNSDPSIGLAASGTGNIASFTATNATTAPVVATLTVTPSYTNGGGAAVPVTFSNATPILIPVGQPGATSGQSTPYPSNIVVSGITGPVTNVTIKLNNFNHTFPDDVDVLLVGPGGQNAIIISDVGSTFDLVNVNLTLDDAAATNLPDAAQIVSGTFRPTNIGAGDAFNAPAPAPAGGSALSAFTGFAANGTWSLYIMDDLGGDFGNFNGGWEITVTGSATGVTCTGTPRIFTITVNPTPNAVANPASQTICSGSAITTIVNSGTVPGTVYNWTRDNTATVTGIAASGTGDISGSLTNTTAASVTVTFTITPTYTNDGVTCTGTPVTATVIVNLLPTITCPGNQSVNNTPGLCSAVVNYSSSSTGAPAPTITYAFTGATSGSGSGNGSGSSFNVGVTTVTLTATNSCGVVTCNFTVTVVDNQPPVITCPGNITVNNDANVCGAVVTFNMPGATDNCSNAINNNVLVVAAVPNVTWLNEVQSKLTLTGQFNTVAIFNAETGTPTLAQLQNYKAVLVFTDAPVQNAVLLGNNLAAYIDGGGGVVDAVFDNASIPIQGAFNTPTYRVLNPAGQTQGSVRTLGTVLLPAHPIMQGVNSFNGGTSSFRSTSNSLAPNAYSIALYDNNQQFILGKENVGPLNARRSSLNFYPPSIDSRSDFWVSTTDGARIMANALTWVSNPVTITQTTGLPSGSTFPVGITTNTFVATDGSGNTATCSFTVTVNDNQAPSVICKPATVILNAGGTGSIVPADVYLSGTDNCGTVNLVSVVPNSFTCANLGSNTVTLTVNDGNGNTSTCTATVTVVDNTAPVITCPANKTSASDAGLCTKTYTAAQIGVPTASDNCSYIISWSRSDGAPSLTDPFPFGITTITWTVTDAALLTATCTQTININLITTNTTVTVTPNSQQYSDKVTFVATVTPSNCAGAGPIGGTVTFKIGTLVMGTAPVLANGTATLANVALLEPSLAPGNPPNGPLKPGIKTVTAVYSGTDADYSVSNATTSLTITCEDARAYYTGACYTSTSSPTSSNAVVTLSATIKDISSTPDAAGDVSSGDIRNATVTFINRDNNTVIATVPVGLVNPGDLTVGTATYNWSITITGDAQQFTIGIIVNNYYCRNSSDDNTVVTVAKPLGDLFISGGGYLVLTNSAGIKAGTAGTKNNFGFNVKYNKARTNLQGNINTIVRRMEGNVMRVYQVKGNVMTSLVVSTTCPKTAIFNGKANIKDITDPLAPISVDGNATLQVKMTDLGEPGSEDSIAITVWNKDGGLWFASKWNGTRTVEQVLGGGNLKVHGGGSCETFTTTEETITKQEDKVKPEPVSSTFKVIVYPNPSASDFSIQVFSQSNEPIVVRILDINGIVKGVSQVYTKTSFIKMGAGLPGGTYFAEVTQGVNKQIIKLIKLY